eukprot:Skav201334  [mRNA]  locus=scaffold1389:180798:183460:- [translate_table: standard]
MLLAICSSPPHILVSNGLLRIFIIRCILWMMPSFLGTPFSMKSWSISTNGIHQEHIPDCFLEVSRCFSATMLCATRSITRSSSIGTLAASAHASAAPKTLAGTSVT